MFTILPFKAYWLQQFLVWRISMVICYLNNLRHADTYSPYLCDKQVDNWPTSVWGFKGSRSNSYMHIVIDRSMKHRAFLKKKTEKKNWIKSLSILGFELWLWVVGWRCSLQSAIKSPSWHWGDFISGSPYWQYFSHVSNTHRAGPSSCTGADAMQKQSNSFLGDQTVAWCIKNSYT